MQLYNARVRGEADRLPVLRIQYKDYASWQQGQLNEEALKEHKAYWREQFEEGIPRLDISSRRRPEIFSYRGCGLKCSIGKSVKEGIMELTDRWKGTPFVSLLFFVKLLLYKYTGEKKIMVGTSIAGRDHHDLQDQIGLYINNLPLVTTIDDRMRIANLYETIKTNVLDVLQHQRYSLDMLIDDIGYKMDPSRPGLFNILIELHTEMENKGLQLPDELKIRPKMHVEKATKFDLHFEFKDRADELELEILYNEDLFRHEEIELMKERFLRLVANIMNKREGGQTVKEVGYRTEEEQAEKNMQELFAEEKF
jgi:non-ribosomal peptide synthetase component F